MPYAIKIFYLQIKESCQNPAQNGLIYSYRYLVFFITMFLFVISIILLRSPLILLMSLFILSCMPLLSLFPRNWPLYPFIGVCLESIIFFFSKTKMLNWFFFIYQFWFSILTLKAFKVFTVLLGSFFIYYIIIARYIFYYKVSNIPIPSYLYFLYFLGIVLLFIRGLTNFSAFLIPFVFSNYPRYGEIMLSEIPDISELKDKPQPQVLQFRGWFTYHKHKHFYPPEMPRSSFIRYIGVTCVFVSLGFTGYACYNYRISALAAVRSADIAAVNAGLISKDEYYVRHPGDCPTSNTISSPKK